jgi:quinol monooxygenase YgiN
MAVYSSGDWHVKPGREQEFVDAWRELARWSLAEFDPGWGKLLRDKEDPTHFISIGEWPDDQVIEAWRASEGFKQRMGEIRQLVDEAKVRALYPAAEITRESAG